MNEFWALKYYLSLILSDNLAFESFTNPSDEIDKEVVERLSYKHIKWIIEKGGSRIHINDKIIKYILKKLEFMKDD